MGQQLLPLEQLGGAARAARAFRRLLFLQASEVEGSPLLKELPRPEVLHHLYSRTPAALESPHTRSRLTPAQVCWNAVQHQSAAAAIAAAAAAGVYSLLCLACSCFDLQASCIVVLNHRHTHPPQRHCLPSTHYPPTHSPLPRPCPSPSSAVQYSLWLDGHSQEESVKFIRTALEACAPKAKGQPGFEELYPLLKRLAA